MYYDKYIWLREKAGRTKSKRRKNEIMQMFVNTRKEKKMNGIQSDRERKCY